MGTIKPYINNYLPIRVRDNHLPIVIYECARF